VAPPPAELQQLLDAPGALERDSAWSNFVHRYSALLLHTARAVAHEHDRTMDAYAHVLEQLRAEDGRRLRNYAEDPRSQFSTWLVVVARRLCVDYLRRRYGRTDRHDGTNDEDRATRRRLEDLLAEEITDSSALRDSGDEPDETIRKRQLTAALQACLTQLLPAQRLLLAMRFEDDLSAREIATALGYPTPFHVYRTLNAILRDLRVSLAQHGITSAEH